MSRSTIVIVKFQKFFKITFSYCHWLVPIYKQYTSTHLVSNVILLSTKITTVQQQDKDMFFFFPLVEVYCVSVYVNIVLTAALK